MSLSVARQAHHAGRISKVRYLSYGIATLRMTQYYNYIGKF